MVDVASPSAVAAELRPMSGRRSTIAHIREIVQYRELLVMLVRKELTVRYKNSTLGFTWSMAQPLFLLVVYTAVFAILGAGFERFAIWVLCGLLVWTLISSSLTTATVSITSNHTLVGKVKFPRAVLPLASVGGALVHFCLQTAAFLVVLGVVRHGVAWAYVWLLPIALATALIVCGALALLLAPCNVYARDTMHLLELLVLGWFWATPILYQYERAAEWLGGKGIGEWALLANPATPIVMTFQRALYGRDTVGTLHLLPEHGPAWYLAMLLITAAVWIAIGYLALRVFDRADVNLAETL
jgi:ABC-type polysaccharide/polyol phosphate export permease